MRFRFGGIASWLAVCTLALAGTAWGSEITQSYDVVINTSTLAPNGGTVEFQTQIVDDPGPGTADTVQVSSLNFGGGASSQAYSDGNVVQGPGNGFTMEIDESDFPLTEYAENDFTVERFYRAITFQVTLTGPDLLGDNPNTLNSYFAVEIDSNGSQVLFDDYNDTVGVTATSSGPVTDNSSSATITPVTILPEPTCLLLPLLPAALLRRRRIA